MPIARANMSELTYNALAGTGLFWNLVPFSATDKQSRMITNAFHWTARDCLRRGLIVHEHTFYTLTSTPSYALPSDYYFGVDEAVWNRTDKWLTEPLGTRRWQREKSGFVASSVHQQYHFRYSPGGADAPDQYSQRRVHIDPTPDSRERIAFEYHSTHWLEDDTTDAVDSMSIASDTAVEITAASHGMSDGDVIYLYGVAGATELNNRVYTVVNTATNTFDLLGTDGDDVSAYTSGGTFVQLYDKLNDSDAANWFPLLPEEILVAGVKWQILKDSGLAYFDERADYESVRDAHLGQNAGRIHMGTRQRSRVGIPESDFPAS